MGLVLPSFQLVGRAKTARIFFGEMKGTFFLFTNDSIDLDTLTLVAVSRLAERGLSSVSGFDR